MCIDFYQKGKYSNIYLEFLVTGRNQYYTLFSNSFLIINLQVGPNRPHTPQYTQPNILQNAKINQYYPLNISYVHNKGTGMSLHYFIILFRWNSF